MLLFSRSSPLIVFELNKNSPRCWRENNSNKTKWPMSKRLNRPSPGLACETTWGPRRHQWSLLWQFPCQVRQDGGEGDRDQDSGRLPVAGLQCENNLFYFAKCLTIFGKEYQGYNMKATNPLSFFMFPSCSKDFELNFDMSTFLRCLPTFSLSTGINLGKCKKSQNFSNAAQSQCVFKFNLVSVHRRADSSRWMVGR